MSSSQGPRAALTTFGGFRLDLAARQLFRGRSEVHLSPKAFDLLKTLVENRPRAISKAELHERLWAGTFVTEANLATLIAELRRALGDQARTPRFIRTVHRFGYAFSGEATVVQIAPPQSESESVRCWLVCGTRKFLLVDGQNVLGRDPGADVWLQFPGVSRRHARIRVSAGAITVEDLGSKNGTFLRDERIATASLEDGDQVRVGSALLTLRIWSPTGSTETQDRSASRRARIRPS